VEERAAAYSCDEKHFPDDSLYDLTNMTWDYDCDYVG